MINQEKRVGVFMQLYRNELSMHKAIKSVLNQTYSNFKFYILVSPQTKEEVRKYSEKDERIVILDGKPGESALTYNKFVVNEGNDYFTSIDGDDWYEPNYLEVLVNYAEKHHTDITACGNYFVNNTEERVGIRNQASMCWETESTAKILPYVYAFFRTEWGKLITAQVILDYKIENFPERKCYGGYGGDTILMFGFLPETKKIGICGDVLYNYRMSPTGGTYSFFEGRLDADTFVFNYVKNILEKYGSIDEETNRFLYLVYGEALSDTTRLILNYNLSEKERIDDLLYIYEKKETYELIKRDREGKLENNTRYYFTKRLFDLIFSRTKNISLEESIVKGYLSLFEILYINWKNTFSFGEFTIFLRANKAFYALVEKDFQTLFNELLEVLKKTGGDEEENVLCLNLLRRTTDKIVLKQVFSEKKFVVVYEELLKTINAGETEQAFKFLRNVFSAKEMPYNAELLVELWMNYAAENENESEFILAAEYQIEVYFKNDKIEQAREKYKELKQIGIDDEKMSILYKYLY